MFKPTLLACALIWQACPAVAAPGARCGEYSAAYYEHGALYHQEADGSWIGIDKDVLEEVAKRTGCVFRAKLDSRVRIWTQLENGTLDVSVSGIPTPEREKFATFIPYLGTRNYVLVHKNVASKARTVEGFLADPTIKIGVVKSFKHGPYYDALLDQLRAKGRVYESADLSGVFNLFKVGRVQAMLALPTSWVTYLKQENMQDQVSVLDFAQKNDVIGALILNRVQVRPQAVEMMRQALREMRSDGTLKAIFTRHVGAELAAALMAY